MPAAPEQPSVEAWAPEPPPPPQRRLGPGLVAGLIALLLVFGMVGLVAARQSGLAGSGASSPEAAASGLLGALDRDQLDARALQRAASYLTGEERALVTTYADRAARLLAAGQDRLGIVGLGARDLRFTRVGGGDGVVVLEAVSGTVVVRSSGGARLQLSLDEARRRLGRQTGVTSARVVTTRAGGRWYVAALPTALEWSRLAGAGGGTVDYSKLTAAARPGASSPEAAVRALLATAGRPLAESAAQLAPAERSAIDAYAPAIPELRLGLSGGQLFHGAGLLPDAGTLSPRAPLRQGRPRAAVAQMAVPAVTGSSQVADGVVKVQLGDQPHWYVIAIRQNGTWYPSMVFTLTDQTLSGSEREHP